MSDYNSWSNRKAANNDGMDPDWRPDRSPDITKKDHCKECGHNLYDAIIKAWPEMTSAVMIHSLSEDLPNHNITLPSDKIKQFNASFKEVGEFAAWVCGVPIEQFCRSDMINYIAKKREEKR